MDPIKPHFVCATAATDGEDIKGEYTDEIGIRCPGDKQIKY